MLPWSASQEKKDFCQILEKTIEGLKKYYNFLRNMQVKATRNHEQTQPIRNFNDNWSLSVITFSKNIKPQYEAIEQAVRETPYYKAIDLINFEPQEKEARRLWLKGLALSSTVNLFVFRYGNYMGNINFIWKIPSAEEDRKPSEAVCIVNLIKDDILKYATRRMRRDFIETYHKKCQIQPVILRNMFTFLTNFEHTPNSSKEGEIDERLIKFLIESDECEVIYDLRSCNGRPNDPKFEPFWEGLEKLIEEKSVVHERRHNDHQYLPFAMSVDDLRNQVEEKLPPGTPIPSTSWIRLNFQPKNPFDKSAKNYTGKFNLRYAVQQRILRVQHVDGEYCRQQFYLLKAFAVKFRQYCLFLSLDDKAIVPVGNPDHPVSTGVRSHHGAIVANSNPVVALDHDFHVAGLVPSVCFVVDIPPTSKDSFYRGKVHVGVKDKVFEPSSALRHTCETIKIIRENHSDDDVNCNQPILILYTDGGPDHRTNYKSVQMALIIEFLALDLDMLIAVRTAPSQSYYNPAERVMSTLNLGLQNVALERKQMPAGFEMQVKSLNSLKALRNASEKNNGLKDAFKESMNTPMSIVKERFSKLKWTNEPILVHNAATPEEINECSRLLHIVDPDVKYEDPKTWSSKLFQTFLENHSLKRHYMYQVLF